MSARQGKARLPVVRKGGRFPLERGVALAAVGRRQSSRKLPAMIILVAARALRGSRPEYHGLEPRARL